MTERKQAISLEKLFTPNRLCLVLLFTLCHQHNLSLTPPLPSLTAAVGQNGYFGKYIGSFPVDSVHNVKGKVYAPTDDTLYIQVRELDAEGWSCVIVASTYGHSSRNRASIMTALVRTPSFGSGPRHSPTKTASSFQTSWEGKVSACDRDYHDNAVDMFDKSDRRTTTTKQQH